MVEEIGLEKSKVDEIYYAILHPTFSQTAINGKLLQSTFHGKMLEHFKQGCQQE